MPLRDKTAGSGREQAEVLALQALGFLAGDPERLDRFCALTGTGLDELKARASDPALLGAVLDHLLQDEPLLQAFAAEAGIAPELPARARRHLPGAAPEY